MQGFTDVISQEIADHLFRNLPIPNVGDAPGLPASAAPGNLFLGWHTAFPATSGDQTSNEATYTGYTRTAVSRATGFSRTGRLITNVSDILGSVRTDAGSPQILSFWTLGVAASGATKIIARGHLGGALKIGAAIAASDIVRCPNHSFANDDRVVLYALTTVGAQAFPGNLTEGTVYFIVNVSGDDFQVALTQGGAAVDITSAGVLAAARVIPRSIGIGDRPEVVAGQFNFRI